MFHSLYSQLSFALLFGVCGVALWKGGPAEKGGALLILSTWLAAMFGLAVSKAYIEAGPFLMSDVILAVGLLALALRFGSLWVGGAMLLQAVGISLHAAYFAADKSELSHQMQNLYIGGKNVCSLAMLLVILAGVLASWRKRVKALKAERQRAETGLPTSAAAG